MKKQLRVANESRAWYIVCTVSTVNKENVYIASFFKNKIANAVKPLFFCYWGRSDIEIS